MSNRVETERGTPFTRWAGRGSLQLISTRSAGPEQVIQRFRTYVDTMDALVGNSARLILQAAGSKSMLGGLLSNPWFFAAVSATALLAGAGIGIRYEPDRSWQAVLLAVGGGSLIVSLAFELYDPAVRHLGKWSASGFFLVGVVTFGGLDVLIDWWADDDTEENGLGLWASVTTDGVPENLAMGSLLASGATSGALAFLFALVVTNGSQSMMSGTNMSENHSDGRTLVAWGFTALVVGGAVLLGYRVLPSFPRYWIFAIEAFAGGAILASLAGEIYPDAYEEAGPYITLATAVGFLGTFLL